MHDKDSFEHIWELMRDIGVAMVVTHSGEGDSVRARPMAARPDIEDNAIYFLTDIEAPKDQEIENNSNACLAFSDPKRQRFVSVTGTAEVFDSPEIAARVWSVADRAFWTDANDPRIRVVRVTPEKGEFWEGPGLLSSCVEMIVAAATGTRPKIAASEKVVM
jgi:general stress protein 26